MLKPDIISFNLQGVKGTLKLEQGVLGQAKVYQDDRLLKKKGVFKAKYLVVLDNGQEEFIELKRGLSFAYSVIFRNNETKLEQNLSTIEYIMGIVPIILLIFTGGLIGAIIGMVGTTFVCNFMRTEKKLALQAIVAVCTALACWLIYLIIAFALASLVYN